MRRGQTLVSVYCRKNTCLDAKGLVIPAGRLGDAFQPTDEGVFWWNTGNLTVDANGRVSLTACGDQGERCVSTVDTEQPLVDVGGGQTRMEVKQRSS